MSEFLDFVIEYKDLLLLIVSIGLTIVCIVIKRKPKTIDDFQLVLGDVLAAVPELVSKVEEPGHGGIKKNKVIDASVKLARSRLQRPLTSKEVSIISDSVSNQIEEVLSAPTKKLC